MMNMIRNLFKPSLRLSDLDLSENRRIVSKALRHSTVLGNGEKRAMQHLFVIHFRVDILVFVLSVIVHRWNCHTFSLLRLR